MGRACRKRERGNEGTDTLRAEEEIEGSDSVPQLARRVYLSSDE